MGQRTTKRKRYSFAPASECLLYDFCHLKSLNKIPQINDRRHRFGKKRNSSFLLLLSVNTGTDVGTCNRCCDDSVHAGVDRRHIAVGRRVKVQGVLGQGQAPGRRRVLSAPPLAREADSLQHTERSNFCESNDPSTLSGSYHAISFSA
jgi:hypothetical protein